MFSYPMIDMDRTGKNIRNKMEQAGVMVKEERNALGSSYQSVYLLADRKGCTVYMSVHCYDDDELIILKIHQPKVLNAKFSKLRKCYGWRSMDTDAEE